MQKSARFTEEDLHKAGYTVVGNEAVPLGDARPDASWDEERLALYAKGELANSQEAERQAILQSRKSAVHLFRAGHALTLARAKCKGEQHGEWQKFKDKHGLANTTANDAIRLYERAKTEEALIGLGITEAKMKFGLAKPKRAKATTPAVPQQPDPAHDTAADAGSGGTTTEDRQESAGQKKQATPGRGGHQEGLPTEKPTPGTRQNGAVEVEASASSTTSPGSSTGTRQNGAVEVEAAGETAQALAEELEGIAQRLSEINQDDFWKPVWSKAEISKAKNAIAAMKKNAVAINRRLNNEDPSA